MVPNYVRTLCLFIPAAFIVTYAFFVIAVIVMYLLSKRKGKYVRMATNEKMEMTKIWELHHIVKFVLILGLLSFPVFILACQVSINGFDAMDSLTPEAATAIRYFLLALSVITFGVIFACICTWPKKMKTTTYVWEWKEHCSFLTLSREERARINTAIHFSVLDYEWA